MGKFLEKLMGAPEVKPLLSDEHFSVDGTLLQAWASHASLKRIDGQEDPPPPPSGPGEGFGAPKEGKKRAKGDFRGIKLSNETHRSSTDPEALLARKSNAHPAQLSYRFRERTSRCDGHVLMENRHDLVVDFKLTVADGYGERDAAQEMAADCAGAHQKTIGADKNYDTKGFVAEMRRLGVTPHVAQNTARSGGSAIDGRTTRHEGYAKSINARRGIEKIFGWIKEFSGLRQFLPRPQAERAGGTRRLLSVKRPDLQGLRDNRAQLLHWHQLRATDPLLNIATARPSPPTQARGAAPYPVAIATCSLRKRNNLSML